MKNYLAPPIYLDDLRGVNCDKIPFDSEHHGETGARKYLAGAESEDLQDGISRGGTETGDPADRPPKKGFGLTAPAADARLASNF